MAMPDLREIYGQLIQSTRSIQPPRFEIEGVSLFDEFPLSVRYLALQQRMIDHLTGISGIDIDLSLLPTEFAGAVFEEFAYFAIGGTTEETTLLPPDETFKYFQHYLHPDGLTIEHAFTTGLNGISIPDGLRLKVDEDASYPEAVYEYTLTTKRERTGPYFEPKYYHHQIRARDFPGFFEGVPLVFVVPTQDGLPETIANQVGVGKRKVGVLELPFSHLEFRGYVEGLLKPILETI